MILYHYTLLDCFLSIWKSKTLRFSNSKNTNDFFERVKVCRITSNSIVHNGQRLDEQLIRNFQSEIFDELDKYKQISFSTDYPDGTPGYASPMMWGQYSRERLKDDSYQDGVCIELESDKLVRPHCGFYEGKVTYTDFLKSPIVEGEDIAQSNATDYFIEKNNELLFFTKHNHWEHESEYRMVCKNGIGIDISMAINRIYVLGYDEKIISKIEQAIGTDSIISFLKGGGVESRNLSVIDVRGYRKIRCLKNPHVVDER